MESAGQIRQPRFIADQNVGKLAKWLRMMGYDTSFFDGVDDSQMVAVALSSSRVILTRDTSIMRRRVVTTGQLKAILITSDRPETQVKQVIETLRLDCHFRAFTICLECNQALDARTKEQVRNLVPPYVFKTQKEYVECPACHRIYWRGTHWAAMKKKLDTVLQDCQQSGESVQQQEEKKRQ